MNKISSLAFFFLKTHFPLRYDLYKPLFSQRLVTERLILSHANKRSVKFEQTSTSLFLSNITIGVLREVHEGAAGRLEESCVFLGSFPSGDRAILSVLNSHFENHSVK